MNSLMLAATKIEVGGEGLVNQLFTFMIIGACVALIYFFGRWLITIIAGKSKSSPDTAITIWNVVFALVGLVVALNFLMGLAGKQFIEW